MRLNRRAATIAAVVLILAAAVPIVAYGVVPLFVKSTLVEDLPSSSPSIPPTAAAATAAVTSASPVATTGPVTLATGQLVRLSLADYGSGTVRIVMVGAERFLRFEDVDIAGAPDMYVYLSNGTDGRPGTFRDLGKLKATNGSFNYPVPADLDLALARSVVVWCRQFSVTVTYALLK